MSPSTFRADLHLHTTASDGSLTPREVVWLAKESGLQGISITDHDTIAAYSEALEEAKRAGLRIGTGVEFSCDFDGMSIHVLGYNFALDCPDIAALCQRHKKRRENRNCLILEKLSHEKMPIAREEFRVAQVGRPHIARLMVEKGYVSSMREAFSQFLGEGRKCYVQGEVFSVEETMRVIRKSGGKVFLAHPHLLPKGPWIKRLLHLDFDGIECYYSRCDPSSERRWKKMCKQEGLLISGGSDFHGPIKPFIPIGCSWVDREAFNAIFEGACTYI